MCFNEKLVDQGCPDGVSLPFPTEVVIPSVRAITGERNCKDVGSSSHHGKQESKATGPQWMDGWMRNKHCLSTWRGVSESFGGAVVTVAVPVPVTRCSGCPCCFL